MTILIVKTLDEAIKRASEPQDPDAKMVLDVEGNDWKTPKAFRKMQPGDELRILGADSMIDACIYRPPTHTFRNYVEAVPPQGYSPADAEIEAAPDYKPSSPTEARRAQIMKRLGGGPLVHQEQKRRQIAARGVKTMIDGLHRRPVQ